MTTISSVEKGHANLPPEDVALANVIHIIARDFNGDTMAFFNSIQPTETKKQDSIDSRSILMAKKFAKII